MKEGGEGEGGKGGRMGRCWWRERRERRAVVFVYFLAIHDNLCWNVCLRYGKGFSPIILLQGG